MGRTLNVNEARPREGGGRTDRRSGGAGVDLGPATPVTTPHSLAHPVRRAFDTYHGHAGALSRVVTMTRDIMAMHD